MKAGLLAFVVLAPAQDQGRARDLVFSGAANGRARDHAPHSADQSR